MLEILKELMLPIIIFLVIVLLLYTQITANYYVFGTDRIPSVKTVIGIRMITALSMTTKNGVSTKKYTYKSKNNSDEVSRYITHLVDKEGFIPTISIQKGTPSVYVKESNDQGKELILTIVAIKFGYFLMIQKVECTLPILK